MLRVPPRVPNSRTAGSSWDLAEIVALVQPAI
jgi:hypothetical protein